MKHVGGTAREAELLSSVASCSVVVAAVAGAGLMKSNCRPLCNSDSSDTKCVIRPSPFPDFRRGSMSSSPTTTAKFMDWC